jgi:hypothetical protein
LKVRLYTREHLKQLLAIFLLGILLGLLIGTMRLANRVNTLLLENESLHYRYKTTTLQLERLEETLAERQAVIIKAIQVEVVLKDQYVKPRLEAIIQQLLQELIGQEISSIDPFLVSKIIDGRIVLVKEQQFELECKLAWIAPQSFIQVRVVRQDRRLITD